MYEEGLPKGFPIHGSFAEKLDFLCREVYPKGGRPYTLEEVAGAVGVSIGYLHALRKGKKTKPTIDVIQRFADFFHIPSGAFFNDRVAMDVAKDIDIYIALRDRDVASITRRAATSSPEELQEISDIIDYVRQVRLSRNRVVEGEEGKD